MVALSHWEILKNSYPSPLSSNIQSNYTPNMVDGYQRRQKACFSKTSGLKLDIWLKILEVEESLSALQNVSPLTPK